jgi:hypothetical protein
MTMHVPMISIVLCFSSWIGCFWYVDQQLCKAIDRARQTEGERG